MEPPRRESLSASIQHFLHGALGYDAPELTPFSPQPDPRLTEKLAKALCKAPSDAAAFDFARLCRAVRKGRATGGHANFMTATYFGVVKLLGQAVTTADVRRVRGILGMLSLTVASTRDIDNIAKLKCSRRSKDADDVRELLWSFTAVP